MANFDVGAFLQSKLDDFSNMVQQKAQPLENMAGSAIGSIQQGIQNWGQQNPQATSNILQAPQQIGQGLNTLGKLAGSQPLLNNTLTPGAGLAPKLPFSPSIGQYAQGNIINPIQQGVKQLTAPTSSPLDRVLGGAQVVGGAFGATPVGAAFNVGYGGAAGALRSLRTGQDFNQSVAQGMSQPAGIGTTGLGLKGVPGMAVDLAAGFVNPVSAGKGIVNALTSNKAMASQDIDDAVQAITRYRANSGDINYMMKQGSKDEQFIRQMAGDYISKTFANKQPLPNVIQELTNRIRTYQGVEPLTMGIKGKQTESPVANAGLYDTGFHSTDAKITNGVINAGKAHPQNYFGEGVYLGSHEGVYPGANTYKAEIPQGLKTLDLTQGNKADQFAQQVSKATGLPLEATGQGLYEDLRLMASKAPTREAGDKLVRSAVDKLTQGYEAVKSPLAYEGQFETVIRKPSLRVAQPTTQTAGFYDTGNYLYHGTSKGNLESIAKEGLLPGVTSKKISLSKTEPYAQSFADSSQVGNKENGVMLRVNQDLLGNKILPSKSGVKADQLNELISKNAIPPEAIEIKVNGEWKPLSRVAQPLSGTSAQALPTTGAKLPIQEPVITKFNNKLAEQGISTPPTKTLPIAQSDFEKEMNTIASKPLDKSQFIKTDENTVTGQQGEPLAQLNGDKNVLPIKPEANIEDTLQQHKNTLEESHDNSNQINLDYRKVVQNLGITPKQEWALVNYSQSPTAERLLELQQKGYDIDKSLVEKAQPLLELHKQDEALRLQTAIQAGFKVNELPNHIRQSFLESPARVDEVLQQKGLSMKPGFANHRSIPDYLSVEHELTPRYTTFGQSHAQAWDELNKSIADKQLYKDLQAKHGFNPGSLNPQNTTPVTAERFPRDNGEVVTGPKDNVRKLDNYLGIRSDNPVSKILNFTGNANAKLQSLLLITPGYTIHGFTIANMFRDLATGVGDALTLHPIRGLKTIAAGPAAALRGFIPGMAGKFEEANAGSIKEMASEGLSYGGKFNYKDLQPNVVTAGKLNLNPLDAYDKLNHAIVGDPTFNKFMFQRKVSLYNNFRDSLVNQGFEYGDAVHAAAEQLKTYDGVVRSLVRSPEMEDALKTFFFAPQYREAILGSMMNSVKGFFNLSDKSYDMSRRLGFGLTATYLAYNALNIKNTGHPMWENGSGHEFELAFKNPSDPNKLFYVPWMPGTTTVPRMVGGTALALAKGDTTSALKQTSGVLSTPIQSINTTLSGKNYFGQDLYDNTKPLLPQQIKQLAQQTFLPSGVNQILTAQQNANLGKPTNPLITAARVFQLPIKEGTDPNSKPVLAAVARSDFEKNLSITDTQALQAYNQLKTASQMNPNDPNIKEEKDSMLANNPTLLANVTKEEQLMATATGGIVRPIATFTPAQQKIILKAEALPPTDPFAKQLMRDNPELFNSYYAKQAEYSKYMATQKIQPKAGAQAYVPPPTPSQFDPQGKPGYVQSILDQAAQAKAAGQKTGSYYNDPAVQAYLTANREHQNQQLTQLGYNQVDKYGKIIPAAQLAQITAGGGTAATTTSTTGGGGMSPVAKYLAKKAGRNMPLVHGSKKGKFKVAGSGRSSKLSFKPSKVKMLTLIKAPKVKLVAQPRVKRMAKLSIKGKPSYLVVNPKKNKLKLKV